ncbi:MAG: 16S rRNA (cytidine(1402)-2'-O)-methyltransferase, partial [Desulfobacterales bacterium]|nr:16S rRNA (cytidine(1402)-2'-O)-methyltransferase [Desulfobacterales bacterium]
TETAGGTLYVVATPIGNLEDITLRALRVLGAVALIAAEDTRKTGRLLAAHDISGHLMAFHEHNERERTPALIRKLRAGAAIALVSNAGTPTVSDPGFRLVRAAIAAGVSVVPIPGVSAVVTALSVAGLPTDNFIFAGFPARKATKRLDQIRELAERPHTLVFYESPRRLPAFLSELITALGDRPAVLGREMTKLHEEFIRATLSEIEEALRARPTLKGECTLLVAGRETPGQVSLETIVREVKARLQDKGGRLSSVVRDLAREHRVPKSRVYAAALKIKKESVKR